jgi:hypothetical protein
MLQVSNNTQHGPIGLYTIQLDVYNMNNEKNFKPNIIYFEIFLNIIHEISAATDSL